MTADLPGLGLHDDRWLSGLDDAEKHDRSDGLASPVPVLTAVDVTVARGLGEQGV